MSGTEPHGSLSGVVEELNSVLASSYNQESGFKDVESRKLFIRLTEKLGAQARDPAEHVYYLATRITQASAIRSAIGLGVFELIEDSPGCSATVEELVSKTAAEQTLVERIMRALASCNIFDDVGEGRYAHNQLSRCFVDKRNRDMFQQNYDFIGKGTYALPEFLAQTSWKNPDDYGNAAFQLGHRTEKGFWEWLAEVPERQALFNSGMQSRPPANNIATLYPFDEELNAEPIRDDEVVLVDIGGGRGHALAEIKQAFPHLRGRMVLQDQPLVIQDAVAHGLPPYIEAQPGSFFEPNPVLGARAYYYRRVFHDWADGTSARILAGTVAAMGPSSRVLVADIAMPVRHAHWSMTLQDLNMMAMAGIERTEKQWAALFESVGLKLHKIWRAEGSNHAIIEGRKA